MRWTKLWNVASRNHSNSNQQLCLEILHSRFIIKTWIPCNFVDGFVTKSIVYHSILQSWKTNRLFSMEVGCRGTDSTMKSSVCNSDQMTDTCGVTVGLPDCTAS
jgi:hypothetical protein